MGALFGVVTEDLHKTYTNGLQQVHALRGISLRVPAGQFLVVRGRSGSGKTTLLHLLAGLQRPTKGRIFVGDTEVSALKEDKSARFRRRHIGVIYQFFNLVPTLSVEHNIALPLLMDGLRMRHVLGRVDAMMERLGIADRRGHMPNELSGGQMQRVAIARSLIADPILVLADEPTGNLDSENAGEVYALLAELKRERAVTIVMMTHDPEATSHADRVIVINDGQLEMDTDPAPSDDVDPRSSA